MTMVDDVTIISNIELSGWFNMIMIIIITMIKLIITVIRIKIKPIELITIIIMMMIITMIEIKPIELSGWFAHSSRSLAVWE